MRRKVKECNYDGQIGIILLSQDGGVYMDSILEKQTAFMTHNGLKVRLNYDFCARYIKEDCILPWFTSIEAFDSLRYILSIITAITMMLKHEAPLYSGGMIAIMYFYGFFISQSYFQMVLWNFFYVIFYMIYSKLNKLFIPYIYIILIIISFITKEYFVLLAFMIVRMGCFLIILIVIIIRSNYYNKKYGFYLGDVEVTTAKLINLYSDGKRQTE